MAKVLDAQIYVKNLIKKKKMKIFLILPPKCREIYY